MDFFFVQSIHPLSILLISQSQKELESTGRRPLHHHDTLLVLQALCELVKLKDILSFFITAALTCSYGLRFK